MAGEGKDYVVYSMKAKCSEGTMENFLTTDTGHGVTYQGNPLMNANDHTKQVNLTHFGDCNAKQIYEQAKAQADEKYKADADDGLFALAGKFIAKTVTKNMINFQEHFMFHKCELDTPLPWVFCNDDHEIEGAPALTLESQCPCRYGGIISIVPVEEETGEEMEVVTEEVTMEPVMAAPEPLEVGEVSQGKSETIQQLEKIMGELISAIGKIAPPGRMTLEAYVNENTLLNINPNWDIEAFKNIYGDDVFEQMKNQMYQYGITNRTSILMFLVTMGVETNWGRSVIQDSEDHPEYENFESAKQREELAEAVASALESGKSLENLGLPHIDSGLGVGPVQVTGSNQGSYIRDLYQSLDPNDPERKRIEDFFGVTGEYLEGLDEKEPANVDNAADYIYLYHPIEASMWFWDRGSTVNDFIVNHQDDNLYNTFMCTQMMVNGTEYKLEALNRFAAYENNCIIKENSSYKTGYEFSCPDDGPDRISHGPNGWNARRDDWIQVLDKYYNITIEE